MQKILVTGAAGFIGFHLTQRLCAMGHEVLGIDNLNDYYDVSLKRARLAILQKHNSFTFLEAGIEDDQAIEKAFSDFKPDIVANMAAQAGVRYSLENPRAYIRSNIDGFINILEGCRHNNVKHLVFASSSSVYGANTKVPFAVNDSVDHPISLYAATKKSNELMAHSYAHLYGLPCSGLRFFTVYGPWGRPDMAYFKFADKMRNGEPIEVYNNGDMLRDFTYIDDIIEGVVRLLDHTATSNPDWKADSPDIGSSNAPYRIYNIGNNNPVKLMDMIRLLENALGKKAVLKMKPMQAGDVYQTYADIDALEQAVGFKPTTALKDGLTQFAEWYQGYYSGV
ncbi:MAG: NAD-dependent epimerase [Alphaproteobacteria bacterium]|nr:NAD-dependent epimerase [Alphaproteobacteria bacterium]